MGGIKLTKDLDFLLNILDLIFGALKVDDLDGHSLLCPFIISLRESL